MLKAKIDTVHGTEVRIRGARSLKKGDRKRSVEENVRFLLDLFSSSRFFSFSKRLDTSPEIPVSGDRKS